MSTDLSFSALGVPPQLLPALHHAGITEPFPIQTATLPDSLAGRDVLGRGKTGSGKTLAFALPMISRISATGRAVPRKPRGLILAPTRELVNQIEAAMAPLASALRLRTTTIFGGVNQARQVRALDSGVDMVIACPGRLEDLLSQGCLTLDAVQVLVLDEADHMADLGFLPAVTRILRQIPRSAQKMLFSATLDRGVNQLVKQFLNDPVVHSVDDETSHVDAMTHHVFQVSAENKKPLISALASGQGKRILFTRTKHQAKKMAKQLTNQGIPAVDLHGNLSQSQRDRNLLAFSEGKVRVLVATDVAARGVHVDSVDLVVHVDPPMEHKSYLHRSGRTARAGHAGDVVTLVLPEQRTDTSKLLRRAAINVQPVMVDAHSQAVADLVGPPAPYVKPAVVNAPSQGSTKPKGRRPAIRSGARSAGRPAEGAAGSGRPSSANRRRRQPARGSQSANRQAHQKHNGGGSHI